MNDMQEKTKFYKGMQIACVPSHADNDLSHPDVEFGFVVSVKEDAAFCRYFSKSRPNELRTLANSELTPFYALVRHYHHPQALIDNLLQKIESDSPLTGILTFEDFLKFPRLKVFAVGETIDNDSGINMTNSGLPLKWIAKKGAVNDWCIYTHFATNSWDYIEALGDKICFEDHIKQLVPCDDQVFARYRF